MLHEEEKLLVSRVCRRCGSNGSMGSDPIEATRPSTSKALQGEINITFASAVCFAKPLQLDFFPLLVQPATGERYASPLPSYQHFSAMGSDPIETSVLYFALRKAGLVQHGWFDDQFSFLEYISSVIDKKASGKQRR